MHAVFVTDIHGETDRLGELPAAELLILGGDLTHFGTSADVERVLDCLPKHYDRILAVLGNCDPVDGEEVLAQRGMTLNWTAVEVDGFRLFGCSGSSPTPVGTPYEWTDEQMSSRLASVRVAPSHDGSPVVLVTHVPPFDSGPDLLSNGSPAGSRAIAELAARLDARGVLCGHIHEARGAFWKNGAILLNPGPFRDGYFGWVRFTELDGIAAEPRRLS